MVRLTKDGPVRLKVLAVSTCLLPFLMALAIVLRRRQLNGQVTAHAIFGIPPGTTTIVILTTNGNGLAVGIILIDLMIVVIVPTLVPPKGIHINDGQ